MTRQEAERLAYEAGQEVVRQGATFQTCRQVSDFFYQFELVNGNWEEILKAISVQDACSEFIRGAIHEQNRKEVSNA